MERKLESYSKLKTGKRAPDIIFSDGSKLSESKSTKLLVFGASWCPKCMDELLKLKAYYNTWIQRGIDVVYVSIDTDKIEYESAYKDIPRKMHCDFKEWETKTIKDYHVFATPTYFLLDKDLKIVLRPKSIEQTNSWLNSQNIEN